MASYNIVGWRKNVVVESGRVFREGVVAICDGRSVSVLGPGAAKGKLEA